MLHQIFKEIVIPSAPVLPVRPEGYVQLVHVFYVNAYIIVTNRLSNVGEILCTSFRERTPHYYFFALVPDKMFCSTLIVLCAPGVEIIGFHPF
jgi:hypothetical protein